MGKEVYIVNVIGTSGEKPKDFDSKSEANNWLEYWEKVKGKEAPEYCSNINCKEEINKEGNKIVGAHVFIAIVKPNKITVEPDIIYIVPLCQSCNKKMGYDTTKKDEVQFSVPMLIDTSYLVPHPKYKNKK